MGRPRKDTKLLVLSGTAQKHPGRYQDRVEVETKGPIGDPPEDFLRETPEMKRHADLWRKIVDQAPVGLLTFSDREFLESTVRWGVISKREGKGQQRALEQYAKNLKSLGMTPEGRAVRGLGGKAAPKDMPDPVADFNRRRRRQA
jgi:hypothetical protein